VAIDLSGGLGGQSFRAIPPRIRTNSLVVSTVAASGRHAPVSVRPGSTRVRSPKKPVI